MQVGDRVRIKADAFPGSSEPGDVAARGHEGTLIEELSPGLWLWRGDDGTETAPIESELEEIEDEPRDFVAEHHARLARRHDPPFDVEEI